MKKYVCLIALALTVAACSNKGESGLMADADYSYQGGSEYAVREQMKVVVEEPTQLSVKKVIKTGRMSMDVNDIKTVKPEIDELVAKYEGYYASERFNDGDYASTYTLSVRIPERNYEKFISDLESGSGTVTLKEIDARDVTEEFIDVETRLTNKRSYLQRYRELLKRANTTKEIMEVEEQIRQLEEEIESAEGRLRYLSDQVSYSTLDITVTQHKEYKYTSQKSEKFWEKVKSALSGGWTILKQIILVIIHIWPIWLLGGVVFVIIKYLRKKRKDRK